MDNIKYQIRRYDLDGNYITKVSGFIWEGFYPAPRHLVKNLIRAWLLMPRHTELPTNMCNVMIWNNGKLISYKDL
ncbi:hypothetical protein PQC38_gp053 [Aeromonas phage BUCT695]|uniref:hypothetical protein n=1 Tax=Aeromonas phage BUCT695 TaxID=2908630 RepID=UPI0023298A58|nr:hypothetical protein PQC38_gp053 [Aeromonas phage BUCT695]UIW10529.1 hypothetical protein [Aeromonas phage BUCT695]